MEELKTQMKGLQAEINELNCNKEELEQRLASVEKDYREATLPEMTEEFRDLIENSITSAVNEINFQDEDSYDITYEINYKEISAEIDLNHHIKDELISTVLEKVSSLFKVIEDNGN